MIKLTASANDAGQKSITKLLIEGNKQLTGLEKELTLKRLAIVAIIESVSNVPMSESVAKLFGHFYLI